MKNHQFIDLILGLMILFVLTSCEWVKPEYEGVLMENCGKNGLSDFKIVSGKVNTMGFCTELIKVPMFEQPGDVTAMEVTTKDGGVFDIDPSYVYSAQRGKGPEIAFTYRQFSDTDDFLDQIESNILNRRVVNVYREEARNFTTDSLMRNLNLYEQLVTQRLKLDFDGAFFTLKEVTSGLTPPESLRLAIERRNEMVLDGERVRQQLEKEKAILAIELEKAKSKVEIARLEAQANLERDKGLTDNVLKEMLYKGWIEKGCPIPTIIGENSFYNIPGKQK